MTIETMSLIPTREEVRVLFRGLGQTRGVDPSCNGRLEWAVDYFLDQVGTLHLENGDPEFQQKLEEVWETVF